jgi:hypothetical protein
VFKINDVAQPSQSKASQKSLNLWFGAFFVPDLSKSKPQPARYFAVLCHGI